MPKKSKFFRAVVEGQTLNPDITVTRDDIESMASSYSPDVYCARINLEHITSLSHESEWRRYGKVLAVKTEEITSGLLAGKLALLVQVEVSDELLKLHNKGQKLTVSVEYVTKFPATGKPYLVGLAFTDDPASLGTQEIKLSLSQRNVQMSQAMDVELTTDEHDLLTRIKQKLSILSKKTDQSDETLVTLLTLTDSLADNNINALQQLNQLNQANEYYKTELAHLKTQLNTLSGAFNELQQSLSEIDSQHKRPIATGNSSAEIMTDC